MSSYAIVRRVIFAPISVGWLERSWRIALRRWLVSLLSVSCPLLINFTAPPLSKKEDDVIRNTLGAIGVAYSHLNDDILVPSHIEEERTRRILVSIIVA